MDDMMASTVVPFPYTTLFRSDRRLRNGKDWVRNGERWSITAVRDGGSITIRKTGRRFGGAIVLPAAYVAEHVDLRSEEHTSELQSRENLVCRLLLEKKKSVRT